MSATVLVVDDDEALAEMIGIVLNSEGYTATFCYHGLDAMKAIRSDNPDLVLLDVMLPGMDGVEICRQVRAESTVPIIMLTAKSDTADVVEGLEAGADDYVTKPFKAKELLARVKARLRAQAPDSQGDDVELGDIRINVSAHEVYRGGQQVPLTPLEFDLLLTLLKSPWKAFSREELLEKIWGYRHSSDTRLVNVHIQRLRAKIEDDPENPQIVRTVRGVGYRAGGAER
ncbi:MAG: MtrAB system response regulator MtrA [Actinomycetaceae bacterium]|nr:MtrAB system response regulator MtrA [Actinomycetaceae bacterium]